jgi:pyruvate formate-lyase/glycerol dehydratase family glycyl radical enzyme
MEKLGSTLRIKKLRERYMATVPPRIDSERAMLITKGYRETEGEPMILRRAKTLSKFLIEKSVFISKGELLVGNMASTYRGAAVFPEYTLDWLYDEFDDGSFEKRSGDSEAWLISEEVKNDIRSIRDYWSTRNMSALMRPVVPDGTENVIKAGVLSFMWPYLVVGSVGHFAPNHNRIVREGLVAVKNEAEKCLAQFQNQKNDDTGKIDFWKAEIMMCDAVKAYAQRYADAALKMAEGESDPVEKEVLLQIAKNCETVPYYPAETYWQALQSIWFMHMLIQNEYDHPGLTLGRVDQYTYPFYKADIEAGRVDRVRGLELIEALFIKLSEVNKIKNVISSRNTGGYSMGQNITVGGKTKDGKDATNDVSFFVMDAVEGMCMHEPPISVRIHQGTPDAFYDRVIEVAKVGHGMPAIQNDEAIIPQMVATGHSLEDSRNYCIIGCVEPAIPGSEYPCCGGPGSATYFNLANSLNVAIHGGINPLTGAKVAQDYGNLAAFKSFDEVKTAYQKTCEYFADWYVTLTNAWETINKSDFHQPIASLAMDNCIEKGMDITSGGARYNRTGVAGVGQSNVGDALSAIKKLVFDDKKYTGEFLLKAIDANWEGYEPVRQEVINEVPKFGNDDLYADEITSWATGVFTRRIAQGVGFRGKYNAGLFPVAIHILLGKRTAATLDGRFSGSPLGDSIGSVQGRDISGPTAVMNSAARIDQFDCSNGTLLNLKFHPTAVQGAVGTRKLRDLTQTYFNMNGLEVQYNVLSADVLRDAQKHPENYPNLVVRVAGYNAFFVELYKELQDDIILRTEHSL